MMLQHPGQVSASEVSASAIVPCLSPPGSLVFEDFANLTPLAKEELGIRHPEPRHLCHRMSSALDSVTVSGRPLEMSVTKAGARSSQRRPFFLCLLVAQLACARHAVGRGHGWILGLEFRGESGIEIVLEATRVWRGGVWKAMNPCGTLPSVPSSSEEAECGDGFQHRKNPDCGARTDSYAPALVQILTNVHFCLWHLCSSPLGNLL